MKHEALNGPTPRKSFENIRSDDPDLLPGLGNAAYFTPRSPRPFDSVTVPSAPSKLHPFLEQRGIQVETFKTSGKDKLTLLTEIAALGVNIDPYARNVVKNPAFTISPDGEEVSLVVPKIEDLGTKKSYPTTSERDARAMELNLETQTGGDFLHWALKNANELKLGEVVFSSMEPVAGSGGSPYVLYVQRYGHGVWLHARWVVPSFRWYPAYQVAFRLRKSPASLKP